jgi:dTDP-4-dehydrorhamnose reductase
VRALITGKNGQVGWELQRIVPHGVEVHAFDSKELDITNARAVEDRIAAIKPDVIINCAAYTAVDKAETERERAFAVNADGARNVARAAAQHGSRLIHISTDFVFDGRKSTPYAPDDEPNPLSVYGASKLTGEQHVQRETDNSALIIRTAWVYSAHGNNFVKTMLRLINEEPQLGIVYDQVGSPTWAKSLAETLWEAAAMPAVKGSHHWTSAGVASWYDFAVAIQEEALQLGMLMKQVPVLPIRCATYPTPAARPSYSILDGDTLWRGLKRVPLHWCAEL